MIYKFIHLCMYYNISIQSRLCFSHHPPSPSQRANFVSLSSLSDPPVSRSSFPCSPILLLLLLRGFGGLKLLRVRFDSSGGCRCSDHFAPASPSLGPKDWLVLSEFMMSTHVSWSDFSWFRSHGLTRLLRALWSAPLWKMICCMFRSPPSLFVRCGRWAAWKEMIWCTVCWYLVVPECLLRAHIIRINAHPSLGFRLLNWSHLSLRGSWLLFFVFWFGFWAYQLTWQLDHARYFLQLVPFACCSNVNWKFCWTMPLFFVVFLQHVVKIEFCWMVAGASLKDE